MFKNLKKGGTVMQNDSKLLLLVLLSCIQLLQSSENQNTESTLPRLKIHESIILDETKQDVESQLDDLHKSAQEEAKVIVDAISEEQLHDCIMSISKLYQELGEKYANDEEQVVLIKNLIAKTLIAFLTPEKIAEIAQQVAEKLKNQTKWQKTKKVLIQAISGQAAIKSISWRIVGTAIGVGEAYWFLHTSLITALSLGVVDIIAKLIGYYFHELGWIICLKKGWCPTKYSKYCCCKKCFCKKNN